MDAQVAEPVFTLDWRRMPPNPCSARDKPLFGMFANPFNRRALERLCRPFNLGAPQNLLWVEPALVWKMPHQLAEFAWFFRESIKRQLHPFLYRYAISIPIPLCYNYRSNQ